MKHKDNTNHVIFLTRLNIWSMGESKGAPSFKKTVQGYIDAGWNITLITPSNTSKYYENTPNVTVITYKIILKLIFKIPIVGFFSSLISIKYGEKKLYSLGRKVLQNNADNFILYAYEVHGVKAAKKLSLKFNIPLITRFQGTVLAPIKETFFNRFIYYPHFSSLKTKANITIMTDDGTLGDLVLENLGNSSDQIFFWRNGVDLDFFQTVDNESVAALKRSFGIKPNEKILLTISRLVGWKRVERAIDSLYTAMKINPTIKLLIVGDGDQKENLIKYVQKLNMKSNVIFVGSIPQTEIKNYLALSDIFLSLYDLSNVGNPLLEAMSAGKPIITLNVGSTNGIIKHEFNGVLLNLDQLHRIPDYIIKIINDDKYASLLGDRAKNYASKNFWSWNERISKEIDIVGKLIN